MTKSKVEFHESGSVTYVGDKAIDLLRLRTMVAGLRFETKHPKMKISRGPSCWTLAKREFGLKGSRGVVLNALESILAAEEAKWFKPEEQPETAALYERKEDDGSDP